MKTRDIFWGVFFVLFGTLLLLDNFNVIELWWRVRDIWKFWPLILVIIGVNLISKKSELIYKVAVAALLLAFGYIVMYGYQLQHY